MTREQAMAGLTDIFRDAFGDDDLVLRPDMTAVDIAGWDSHRMVGILIAVETRFGIRLRSGEIDGLQSVDDLAEIVTRKA